MKGMKHPNTSTAQRERFLTSLESAGGRGISTLEARNLLDILHPSGRIKELREQGYEITTIWSREQTATREHRVARYVLISESDCDAR